MFKRWNSAAAGTLCALALALSATPKAHAEPQVRFAYEAGQISNSRLFQGSRLAAEQLMAPFVGALHGYVEDDEDGRSWWLIVTRDGEEAIAICPEPAKNYAGTKIVFEGEIVAGPFQGAKVTGSVFEDDRGSAWSRLRVQATGRTPLDVEFVQPLEIIEIEDDDSE